MQIREIMTKDVQYIPTDATLTEAALKMYELDCGFLPLGNAESDKLRGVVTDRDIAIRAIANGLDPNETTVDQIKTEQVLYCYARDEVEEAANSMNEQQVHRLIVLNNEQEKKLCGVISLGDIFRHDEVRSATHAALGITASD